MKQMLVCTKESEYLMLSCLWSYQVSSLCWGVSFFLNLNTWFSLVGYLVSYLRMRSLSQMKKGKTLKHLYSHWGSITPFNVFIPRTTFSSRFHKIRATEFFRRDQKFGKPSLCQLADTAFNQPPELFWEAEGITISKSHSAKSTERLQAVWIKLSHYGLQFFFKAA